jgi:hypothetical protein
MKLKDFLIQVIPLFLVFVVIAFTKNEILISLGIIFLVLATFKIKYYKGEWKVFLAGVIIGFLSETVGDLIYKLQYWEGATLLGLFPIWLPLFWGFGFIIIRRIGDYLVKI